MAAFSVTAAKRAIKVAQDMGLHVTGYEVTADGIKVFTAPAAESAADAALEAFMRGRNGNRETSRR
ncbi:hypothetical protein LAZ29_12235 [Cereibacter sphaeroides]|uniref:hypothetical protein n=1 Tax=Cereibacter sphaeroides TaxID=1063 RepID=UPI001F295D7A|nr:hypothetical protein [Cereibacter sphaeroides]MCE6951696.1 hypothetical protein [Cereibacter sphaeroides]